VNLGYLNLFIKKLVNKLGYPRIIVSKTLGWSLNEKEVKRQMYKKKNVTTIVIVVMILTAMTAMVMLASAAPDGISEYAVIKKAYSWLGVSYEYGGESKNGVDCSGLVRQVYMQSNVYQTYYYDRTAEEIRQASYPVWPPRPGDVVIFVDKDSGICTHVGIYIGPSYYGYWDSYFIHAGTLPGEVVEDRLYYSPYYGTGWWYSNFDIYFARYNPDYYIS